jgi:PatG C-terminal
MDQAGPPDIIERPSGSPPRLTAEPRGPGTAPAAPASFVYAIGSVVPQFPSLAIEKEVAQAVGRTDTAGHTDREALESVLSDRAGRYLARQVCWVFTVEGLETYILVPRDPGDLDMLIEAVRPRPRSTDIDVVIGVRGPVAPPDTCNGLQVPIVVVDQLYSFDRDELIREIPRPEDADEEQFRAAAAELLDRIGQLADNAGATDEHRAINYLAVRYPAIYVRAAEAHAEESSLTGVEVRPSRLSGARTIMDVIFSYTHRRTDVTDKYFCRVDVTEEFPFLVTKLSHFYER